MGLVGDIDVNYLGLYMANLIVYAHHCVSIFLFFKSQNFGSRHILEIERKSGFSMVLLCLTSFQC